MQTVQSEKELSNLSVTQLKSICSQVGIHPCKNQKATAKALKAIEMEASLSSESSKSESSNSEDPRPQVTPADNLMQKVLLELTSLKHKVKAISNTPTEASGNIKQLTELHDELVRERQAKKIYPDHDFKKEHNQNNYNTCRDITHLLTHVDSSLLPFNQQEALAKALKQVEGCTASVIMGSLKGWGTASHIASDEQTFLELHWKDAITEAQHKCKAEDKGKGQLFFRSS
jgi:hypothetical protein